MTALIVVWLAIDAAVTATVLAARMIVRTIVLRRQRALNADRIAVNAALLCIKAEALRAYDEGAMSAADFDDVNRWELQR